MPVSTILSPRVLLLGGTSEASQIAKTLALQGVEAVFSYAGRTKSPQAQPLPTRIGGFGGAGPMADYLRAKAITHLIDATHPFAARISANALIAAAQAKVALIALERPAWRPQPGDLWHDLPGLEAAARALPAQPGCIFLATGRQGLELFAAQAQSPPHRFVVRLVDAPSVGAATPLGRWLAHPQTHVIAARGPFSLEGDLALMRAQGVTHLVAKNAGGEGAYAKIAAARALGLPVFMIARPKLPARRVACTQEEVLRWLARAS